MSNAQHLEYQPYGGGGPYVDLHTAETVAYGVYAAPGTYDDTYRPAYDTYRPAYEAYRAYEAHVAYGNHEPYGNHDARGQYQAAWRHEAYGAPPSPPATLVMPARQEQEQEQEQETGRAARRRRSRGAERPEYMMRRLLPQALVVAFLAGGTTAFVADDKAVELTVDGTPRTLHTFADDVSELLAEEGVRVAAHDMVVPAPGTELTSGEEVAVGYGRPVRLTLDGQRHDLWTTARTVEEALQRLGVRVEGAYLSVPRAQRIGRAGLALDVRTERAVTVMADGRARTLRTNAATVREVVAAAGITLRGQDTTSVAPGSFPRDGQTVTVLRITGTREVREEAIPFAVRRTDDPSLFKGTELVEQTGQPGLLRDTYSRRIVNGVKQRARRIRSEVVRQPREEVVKVGTKPLPPSVRGAEGLDWRSLAICESGGRPDAVDASGTYGGLYQFDTHTWHTLGGRGRPQDAPAAEQTFRAKKLYVRRGASPWPHCGARLHG